MFYVVVNITREQAEVIAEAPRARLRRDLEEDAPVAARGGNVFTLDRKDAVRDIYTNINDAYTEAQEQASENPGKQYAVMKIDTVFETVKPTVIKKVVDAHGQLVLEKAE